MPRQWKEQRRYAPRPRIEVEDGIKARNARKGFASQWWARRWLAALDSFGWSNRLRRGRSYASTGQVVRYELKPGRITADVQGSRPRPYHVTIDLPPLSDPEWASVLDSMARQAIFGAKLLTGEMPQEIETVFTHAGCTLMPAHSRELATSCSCPDVANPCKHIAAVYYIIAEAFDQDPFLIFQLRGRTQEDVIAALRARTSAATPPNQPGDASHSASPLLTEAPPVESRSFWRARPLPSCLDVGLESPRVPCSVLRRLGPPGTWTDTEELVAVLEPIYETVSQQARLLALGNEPEREQASVRSRSGSSRARGAPGPASRPGRRQAAT